MYRSAHSNAQFVTGGGSVKLDFRLVGVFRLKNAPHAAGQELCGDDVQELAEAFSKCST